MIKERVHDWGGIRPNRHRPTHDPDASATGDREPVARRVVRAQANMWWLGVHPGAGETTLAELTAGTRAADHAWPLRSVSGASHDVTLVTRLTEDGVAAALAAAAEARSDELTMHVRLHGVVLIPARRESRGAEIRLLERQLGKVVPRLWVLPWMEGWQHGQRHFDGKAPAAYRHLCRDLAIDLRSAA
ncbi:hypothetical protein ACFDTO_07665 [Microbacteriaceae bacterium 4G12]